MISICHRLECFVRQREMMMSQRKIDEMSDTDVCLAIGERVGWLDEAPGEWNITRHPDPQREQQENISKD